MLGREIGDEPFGHDRRFLGLSLFDVGLFQNAADAARFPDDDGICRFADDEAGDGLSLGGEEQIGLVALGDFLARFDDRFDQFGGLVSLADCRPTRQDRASAVS